MERDGDGENLIFRAWWRVCGCWCGCGCAGVGAGGCVGGVPGLQGCKVGRLQGCKYIDNQSVSLHLFCWGLILV